MTTPPKYRIKRNEIVMRCDTPESEACAQLMSNRDRNGGQFSDWWGHPVFAAEADGTMIVTLPANARNMLVLHECGAVPDSGDAVTAARMAFFRRRSPGRDSSMPMKPFQQEGFRWLLSRDLCGILGDDAGLGKTLMVLSALTEHPERFLPAIVMAPAHIKLNWEKEWVKWGFPADQIAVLFGRKPDPAAVAGKKIIVLNQHILKDWADTLMAVEANTFIVDEAHSFVNSNTKTYPIAKRIAASAGDRVLLITATPLVNDLDDLWGLANLMRQDILGTKTVFADTFMPEERAKRRLLASRWQGSFSNRGGWAAVARARLPKALKERRIEELKDILHKTVVLKRRKRDVIDQLPKITESHIRIPLERNTPEGTAFWKVEDGCLRIIDEAKDDILASGKMLPALTLIRRNAVNAKIPYAEEWIRDWLLGTSGEEKLIVVGWSKEPLIALNAKFRKCSVLINGDVEARKKKTLAEEFEKDAEKRVLFGNVKSIGTGIDLVCAATMLFIELPLTEMDLDQTKGRIDRLSQTRDHLFYYDMTVADSYEEKKGWANIRNKGALAEKLGL